MIFESLENRCLLAADPAVALSIPATAFIGDTVNFSVTFDNASATDTGYGPFVDVIFPNNGADGAGNTSLPLDGLSFVNATYLGIGVTSTVLTFPGSGAGPTCVEHPYAVDPAGDPLQVCGTPGDTLVVFQLPFGSFTPDQPPAVISVTADMSDFADLGVPLTLTARAGFQFGNDPLDNPATDPSLVSQASTDSSTWTPSASVTPTLIRLTKTYVGPEDETATGPNFPRQYVINVEVATGQTVTNLDVSDFLPNNLAFLSLDSASPAGYSVLQTPTVGAAANPFDNDLVVQFPSITGVPGPDATVTFSFFVPLNDANGNPVINADTGDDVISENQASAIGDWQPLDPRDQSFPPPTNNAVADPVGPEHTLTDKSIAIQKSVTIQNDVGATGPSPGDTLEYTLQFQVSDFFAFQDVLINDILSDGQRFLATFTPVLTFTEHGTTSGPLVFDVLNYNAFDRFTLGTNPDPLFPTIDGTQRIELRVSDELAARLGLDAQLLGGCVPSTGTGGPVPDCSGFNGGPTVGTITYRAVIQEDFTDDYPPGNPSVDQGDALSNAVTIEGNLLNVGDLTPNGNSEADTSGAGVVIVSGNVQKTVYAINGDTSFSLPPTVTPGDTLTYRLTVTLPLSRFENGRLVDYPPLPIFDATTVMAPFDATVSATAPPTGTAKFGPSDTFFALSGIVPTITTNGTANSIEFGYGDYSASPPQATTADILFTMTVSDDPFADGLFLTNQVRAITNNTGQEAVADDAIVQIVLAQPVLSVTKGVVATDNPAGVFSPLTVGPVTFTAPTATPTANPRWNAPAIGGTDVINSTVLTANPIDSNLAGIDAGDLVTFAVVVENTGSSRRGAFDIRVRDTLPAGFAIPGAGLNLSVTDGTGAAIAFTNLGSGLFDPTGGIELTDPGPTPDTGNGTDGGALDQYSATSGRNILVITYDLVAQTSVQPLETIINTATLFNYAGAEGGPDHTAQDKTDDATVTIAPPAVDKSLVGTSVVTLNNANNEAVIGETITYQTVITLPEGVIDSAQIVDTLDQGLAFVSLDSIVPSSGDVTSSINPFANTASFFPTVTGDGIGAAQVLEFDLGTLANANTVNIVAETLTLTYTVVVLNTAGNQSGGVRDNVARFEWVLDGDPESTPSDSADPVTILEPVLQVDKTAVVDGSGTVGQAGSTVQYTMVISHAASTNTDAYDVTFSDPLPAEFVFAPLPAFSAAHSADGDISGRFQISGTTLETIPGLSFDLLQGQTVTVIVTGTLATSVLPNRTIGNTATIQWTSLDGPDPNERTGTGGVNDYTANDGANITTGNIAVSKSIATTSEAHTSGSNLAIGEIVRYRLVTTIPQGTLPSFVVTDLLPNGLLFLNDGTTKVAFVSTATNSISSSVPAIGTGPWVAGDQTTVSTITPSFVLPSAQITPASFSSGTDPVFSLGTLTNTDVDGDPANLEYVIIEFNALVQNISTNETNDNGESRNNRYTARVGTDPALTSNQVTVTLREPSIPTVTKVLTGAPPVDAFDVVTYQISFANTGSTTAFETNIYDALNATYFDNVTVTSVTVGGSPAAYSNASAGNILDVTLTDPLVATGSPPVVVTFTATLTQAVGPGQTLSNTATATYTSLPGTGTLGNPTGSNTPGGSGAANGERNGSGGVNDYRTSGSIDFTLGLPALAKSITNTSNPYTDLPEVSVGEVIWYTLVITVPEGTTPNAVVVDTVTAGLSVIDVVSITADPDVVSSVGYATVESNAESALVGNQGQLTLDFGTLTNSAVNDGNAETITVVYRAVVRNVPGNARGTTLDNSAVYTWTTGTLTATADDLTVVEPVLNITKTILPETGDAGDVFTVTLVVTNPAAANDATALDVELEDLISSLAPYATYVGALPPTVVDTGGITGTVASVDGSGNVTVTYDVFPVGATSTVTFQIELESTVGPGQVLTNTADIQWTSIPGAPGQQSPNDLLSVERTGNSGDPGGAENDYNATASDTVTVLSKNLEKSIVATSEAHTDSTDLAIGEIVRYRMFGTIVEGTLNNLILRDSLPAGLALLNDGQIFFGLISDDDMTTDPDLFNANGSSLPPTTFQFPTNRITANGNPLTGDLVVVGQDLAFDFGTIVNNDHDENVEYGVLEFNVLVLNAADNTAGAIKSNFFQLDFIVAGNPATLNSAPVIGTIVEPSITNLQKSTVGETPVDAGDTVTYELRFSNQGTADAFETNIYDALDATYFTNVIVTSVTVGGTPLVAGTDYTNVSGGNVLNVTLTNALVDNGSPEVVVTFTAELTVNVQPNQTLNNTATVTYTSLPGTGTTGNPTGTNTPGGSGDEDGERNGSGTGQNTYNDSANANFTTGTPAFAKSIFNTNQAHTAGTNVAIGEIITYELVVTVPEGTTPNMLIRDALSAGLGVIDPADLTGVVTITASPGVSLQSGTPFSDVNALTSIPGGAGSSIEFDFGTVINANTDDGTPERITIRYQAVVLNQAAMIRGSTANNSAVLTSDNLITLTAEALPVTVVEPTLELIKNDSDPPTADAGDIVDFQLTIRHAMGSNAAALDVVLSDPLAATANFLSYAGTVIVDSGPAPTVDATGGNLTLTWGQFNVGDITVLRIQAVLDNDAPFLTTLTNVAALTWTSIVGDPGQQSSDPDSTERTGSGVGPNIYVTSDSGDARTLGPAIAKSVTATSEPSTGSGFHTAAPDLTIGETVTFDLTATLPDGRADDLVISDLLPVDPPGVLNLVSFSVLSIGQDLFTDLANLNALTAGDITLVTTAHTAIATFPAQFYNRPDTVSSVIADNQIVLRVVAQLINAAGNANGDTLTNEVLLEHTVEGTTNTLRNTATVDVVEPQLEITKDAVPLTVVGGDTITFTITVDHTGLSTSDAFDVLITDVIPAGLTYIGNVTAITGPAPTVTLSLPTVEFFWATIPLGDGPYQFTFQATVDATVQAGDTFVNTADLVWSTLPGVDPNERSYTDDDDAPTITGNPAASNPSKSIVATSEASTTGNDVTIGEIVRYRLQAEFTGGTFPNVTLVDTLPAGLTFLNDGEVRISFTADNAWTLEANLAGASNNAVPPTFVLPAGRILVAGQTVTFDLGTITNNDADANLEFVTLEFNVLVANVPGNVDGVSLSNAFDLFVDGDQVDTTRSTTVTIVEPQLTITKDAVPVTVVGGDTITFTITVDHTGLSTSDAFDVLITDAIPAGLTYIGNVTAITGPAPTVTLSLPTVEFFWATIPLGDGPYQFTFQATVDATVQAGDTFVNTADLVWSTLPGVDPNERSYTDDDDAPTITGNPAASNPSKSIVATSEASTTGNDVTIGEIVRYRLQAEFTGGTFPNVTLVDTLPAGLTFLNDGEVRISFTADNAWTLEANLAGASNNAVPPTFVLPAGRILVAGQTVTFDLGTITNNDADANLEFVTLEFNVLVANVPGNVDGVSLSNAFDLFVDGGQVDTTQSTTVEIVEPALAATKAGGAMTPDGVTYVVSIANSGNASAFDVRVLDAIPAALTLTVGSIQVTSSGPPPVFDASGSTSALLDVVIEEIPAGETVVVRYTTVIVDPSTPTIPNFVDVDYTSLPDSNGTPGNPTGSTTPGGPGSGTGERNNSGGVNDYLDDDDAELGSLGDFVWWDVNGSGSFNPGEPGLANVTMILIWPGPDGDFNTPGDNVIRTTTTDANGNYFFNALPAGVFRVVVDQTTLLAGLGNSYDLDGNLDSQVDVPLAEGQSRMDVDFGYASVPAVGDDGDDNFSTIGNWTGSDLCTGFFGDSASWVRPGNGSECAVWTFNVLPGIYRVSATWFSPSEFQWFRAIDAPFTMRDPNGTTADLRVEVNQKLNPGDYPGSFTEFGYDWIDLSAGYAVSGGLLTVSLCNDASSWVVADAIRIERISDLGPAPPTTGLSPQWMPIPLIPSTLAALASGGSGEASGSGPMTVLSLDNRQPGYSTVGRWTSYSGAGYQNTLDAATCAVCGNAIATWNFENLTPGVTYQAYATWTAGANREANAIYRLFRDDPAPLKMNERVGVNQRLNPDDFFWDGVGWESLGLITPDQTRAAVQLTNAGSGLVVADSVLLIPVTMAARPRIAIELAGQPIYPSSSSIDFGTTTFGAAQSKTFLVRNAGDGTLVLFEPVVAAAGFTTSGFGATELAPGQSTVFTLTQTATTTGTFAGPVSITSNDPEASPFVFQVTGQVATAAPGEILSTTVASAPPLDGAPAGLTLTTAAARQLAAKAVERWAAAGINSAQRAALESTGIEVQSLNGTQLSQLTTVGIVLDRDAAGHGWFLDATPWEDAEFIVGQPPAGIDLLTVLLREMGHRIGQTSTGGDHAGLMSKASLPAGTRAVPNGQLLTGRNPVNSLDVDGDGQVAPIDVLLLLNRINTGGPPLSPVGPNVSPRFYDVTGDNHLSAADALLVINHLNGVSLGGRSAPEPEADSSPTTMWTPETDVRWHAPLSTRLVDLAAIELRSTESPVAAWPAANSGARPTEMSGATNSARAHACETSDPWDDWDDLLDLLAENAAEQWNQVGCKV
ncbi:MAG: isopeptide-forming domain-containing fimbrial protein [Pirellulaceae bacterium]|nr:isopeptide-forming domain-containing fimbrial protein [Pirellulaceae bacterium]